MESIIIGIAGGSGSGKSTFTNRIKSYFGDDVAVLYHDNYYRCQDGVPFETRVKVNYDHPDSLETDLLIEHLKELKAGRSIESPVYDYSQHNRAHETIHVEPKRIILVEGILLLTDPRVRELLDIKIYVDADACPVVGIVEELAIKYKIPVTLLCDTNHVLYSDYSEVIVVGAGADAVDYKLISLCHKGDIVVSQDYGVAAMALGKGAYAIHQSGKWYTNENIDRMLMERHLNKKARRSSHKNHIRGPRKRTNEDDERFAQSFEKLLLMAKAKKGE